MNVDAPNVCQDCVGDDHLRAQFITTEDSHGCDLCGASGSTVSISWLADHVKQALDTHYCYTSPDPDGVPLEMLKEGLWERAGTPLVPLIASILRMDEEPVATEVQKELEQRFGDWGLAKIGEEDPFSADAHYAGTHPDGSEYDEAWADLERTLRTESRYFNPRAEEVLEFVFDDIEKLASPFGITAVQKGGPRTVFNSLFRGRVAKSDSRVKEILADPEKELGAPPSNKAVAGRMNAAGIPAFYGADSHETVLAEVRPPVGSRVITARFKFTRDFKFLNITGFKGMHLEGSKFDPVHTRQLKQLGFLKRLSKLLSRPILPGDETSEYLVTQVVAEFLSKRFDGLIFPSSQAGSGYNAVLFSPNVRVEVPESLPGTKIEVECVGMTTDGPEPDYTVVEQLPEGDIEEPAVAEPDPSVALNLERNTLRVHHVEAVTYKIDSHFARRYQFSPHTEEF